jgi:hypothetical protein
MKPQDLLKLEEDMKVKFRLMSKQMVQKPMKEAPMNILSYFLKKRLSMREEEKLPIESIQI